MGQTLWHSTLGGGCRHGRGRRRKWSQTCVQYAICNSIDMGYSFGGGALGFGLVDHTGRMDG